MPSSAGSAAVAARLLVDARAELGECALWCGALGALYWTDIDGRTVSRRHADGSVRRWAMPDRVACFALCADPSRLLLGLASGVALYDLDRAALLSPVVPVEPGQPRTRLNDGRCDPQGRFVFGMFDQSPEPAPIGGVYRVGADLAVERLPLPPAAILNSLAFSPDGRTLYWADSPTREIRCCDYRADGGLGAPRVFARLPAGDDAVPDGSAIDAEGGLWNAQWGGGRVVRYGADGAETGRVALPVPQPSCVAFGGESLDRLYVTSARKGLDAAALRAAPHSGGVFEALPGRRGLPEHRFGAAGGR